MKFTPLAVALVVYSGRIVDADISLYTQFSSQGQCQDSAGQYYSYATSTQSSPANCATFCQTLGNLSAQVGFTLNASNCHCRYTQGESPPSGLTYTSSGEGAITQVDGGGATCFVRNAYDGYGTPGYVPPATPNPSKAPTYSNEGVGMCLDSQNKRFNHRWTGAATPEDCAVSCQALGNLADHTGFSFHEVHRCHCEYTAGQDAVSWTYGNGVGPVAGADGNIQGVCYRYGANPTGSPTAAPSSSSPTGSPSASPTLMPTTLSPTTLSPVTQSPTGSPSTSPTVKPITGSPSASPSAKPVTGSPSTSPLTMPVTGPTTSPSAPSPETPVTESSASIGSPTKSPTDSPTTSIASLYYPDWSKSNGGCKNGGGQPMYMTLDRSTWMFETRNGCCLRYYGWMMNECEGTSGATLSSGLWFPDWAGSDDTCKNDGSEPEYMAMNPASWMFSTQLECCEANFGWMVNECLGSSDPNAGASNKWYMKWDAPFKCKQDCQGTGPSCGGLAASWDELFDTREACCAEKAAWNPTDCLVD